MGFVPDAADRGARILVGGERPKGFDRGFYFSPTVAEVDSNSHRLCQEELFGPFASLMRFDTDEQAYRIANDSRFGLDGYAWSRHIDRILSGKRWEARRGGKASVRTVRVRMWQDHLKKTH